MKNILFVLAALTVSFFSCSVSRKPVAAANGVAWNLDKTSGIVRLPQYVDDTNTGGLFWATYDATRRSSFLYVKNDKINLLSEVQPDAATQLSKSLETALSVAAADKTAVSGDVKLNTIQTIATLGSRTTPVNMQRDALFAIAQNVINCDCHPNVDSLMVKAFDNAKEVAIYKAEADARVEEAKATAAKYKWMSDSVISANKNKKDAVATVKDTATSHQTKNENAADKDGKTKTTTKTVTTEKTVISPAPKDDTE